MEEWDGVCPDCGNSRFYDICGNIYECRDCGCRIVDESSNLNSIFMYIDGEYQEVIPFLTYDGLSSDIEAVGFMTKDNFNYFLDKTQQSLLKLEDILFDLGINYYTRDEINEWVE